MCAETLAHIPRHIGWTSDNKMLKFNLSVFYLILCYFATRVVYVQIMATWGKGIYI